MADMSSTLSEIFNVEKTASEHTEEDLVKQANLQFFGDLCASEGIDLSQLDDTQVAGLFKVAMDAKDEQEKEEEGKKGDAKEDEKEKEASAAEATLAAATDEWLQKRAAHTKVAEADFLGRLMAHTFADELKKMAAAGENPFAEKGKKEGKDEEKGEKGKDDEKEEEKKASARQAALVDLLAQRKQASAAPAAGTSTPSFDEVASYEAINMLKSAGVPEKTAFERVNAAYILGLPESEKIAAASTVEQALEHRALEICERAGFTVDWAQA